MLSENLQKFYDEATKQPWGILSYEIRHAQLENELNLKNLRILDFGSGFGITANYLAKNNHVTAVEPNAEMLGEERIRRNNYTQINGRIDKLRDFENACFDLIICHNVLEYAAERAEIVKEFSRIIKPGGILSVVKHNRAGRIIHKIVFENDLDEVLNLLAGGESRSSNFGKVNYYEPEDLTKWSGDKFKIEKILGIRMFFALQDNALKFAPEWREKMFETEMRTCGLEPYKSMAFLHHILLRKI